MYAPFSSTLSATTTIFANMNKHGCISLGSDVTPGLWEDIAEREEVSAQDEADEIFPFLQLSAGKLLKLRLEI